MIRDLWTQGLSEFPDCCFFLPPIYFGLGSREAHNLDILLGAHKKHQRKPFFLSQRMAQQDRNLLIYPFCSPDKHCNKSCTLIPTQIGIAIVELLHLIHTLLPPCAVTHVSLQWSLRSNTDFYPSPL